MIKTCLILLLSFNAYCDELFLSEAKSIELGFEKVHYLGVPYPKENLRTKNSLAWPFEAPFKLGFLGNNFVQYQPYAPHPGYHGGNDMVLERDSWVVAPFAGRLEAGHYAYNDLPNGSREKFFKPWPASGPDAYFELTLIDKSGMRYEFHHVDKASLPKEIVNALNSGKAEVKEGQRLGQVYRWGTSFHYDHVHVNVIDAAGKWFNPQYFFKQLPDTIAPKVFFMAKLKDGSTKYLNNLEELSQTPASILIAGYDRMDHNHFVQAPIFSKIKFESGEEYFFDGRLNITSHQGGFMDIRLLYPSKIKWPGTNQWYRTPGSYYPLDKFFIQEITLPGHLSGKVNVFSEDMAGNRTKIKFSIVKSDR